MNAFWESTVGRWTSERPILAVAGVGTWVRRSETGVVTFPALMTAVALASGAVTHENLGTAFRHRGQILWALAILSAAGLQWWVERTRKAEEA